MSTSSLPVRTKAASRLTRRELFSKASATTVALLLTQFALPELVFPGEEEEEEHVPFLKLPRVTRKMLDWETLDAWLTPQDQVFDVHHYNEPALNAAQYRLEIAGLVEKPLSLTLEDVRKRTVAEELMTLECSGNGSSPGFMGAVYNSRWTGTPLSAILKECGVKPGATEVVFFGHDTKKETIHKVTVEVPFGRSMSIEDAMNPRILLAYTRNGRPLERRNGAPLRLIVPGWYGIANVKWLKRIEVRNRRYMGRFMGRDYVTLRGERQGNEVVFVESSVTRMNLKSIIARVTRKPTQKGLIPVKAYGAAWSDGTPVAKVEVQIDGGPWRAARLDETPRSKYCWVFFSVDAGGLRPGKHVIVSRAIDVKGRIQPTDKDDEIALKKTYWEAYQQVPREFELSA
jgi:DMSO/TMAO reductase YedYZ molybdopterin-dependent catalytic subunit